MNHLKTLVLALATVLGAGASQAATIALSPTSVEAESGEQFTLNLVHNFGSLLVLAGGTDFTWDPSVLSFKSFSYASDFAALRDPAFDTKPTGSPNPWDLQSPGLLTIGYGQFNGISLPTDTVIGTLVFEVVGAAGSSTLIALADSLKWANFFDTDSNPIAVEFTGTTVDVMDATVVPVPAAAWLLLSGAAGLLAAARRRAA